MKTLLDIFVNKSDNYKIKEAKNERKIHKRIDEFLNTPKRNITQAQEVDADVFFDSCKSILDYIKNPENF